jgi:predicted acetyltransferase
LEIKKINATFKQKIISLYEQSGFDQNGYFFKCLHEKDFLLDFITGVFEEDELLAIQANVPSKMSLNGNQLDILYLSNVTVAPGKRGDGLSKILFNDVISKAKSNNLSALVMHPFNHSFYWNSGFASAFSNWALKIPTELMQDSFKFNISKSIKSILKTESLDNKNTFSNFFSLKQYFWNQKNDSVNELIIPEKFLRSKMHGNLMIAYCISELNRGYMLYKITNRKITVHEIRYNNKDILYSFIRILQGYKWHCTEYFFENVNYNFPMELLIKNYWNISQNVMLFYDPFRMIRIIDLYKVFLSVCNLYFDGNLSIKIKDNLILENNLIYNFDGNGRIHKHVDGDYMCCSTDIRSIAELITGKSSPQNLFLLGRLDVSDEKCLDTLNKIFTNYGTLSLDMH